MFSRVRKVRGPSSICKKPASLLLDRKVVLHESGVFGVTVTNTFAGHCIKCRSPPDASLHVLELQPINSNRQRYCQE